MNGPEHYREAERLLRMAHHWTYGDGGDPAVGLALATEATGHAMLAAAAATALVDETPRSDSFSEYRAWQSVAGSPYQGAGDTR
ncbi:hypothetical protein K1Y80_02185 [Streptomyces sp. MAG02]|nr:hypothetical protein [Streptomyces sp. MAG02]